MKKRLLAFFLCLSMMLPLAIPAVSAATEDENQKILYAHYGTATMDGERDDCFHFALYSGANNGADQESAMFAAAWDADNLYIAMNGIACNAYGKLGRAIAFTRGYVSFENGFTAGIEENGTILGTGVEVAKAASTSVTMADIYGTSMTREGVMYVEFKIPLSNLNFYDRGDGSLATQVSLQYVNGGNWDSTSATLVLTDDVVLAGRDSMGAVGDIAEFNKDYDCRATGDQSGGYGGHNPEVGVFGYATSAGGAVTKPVRSNNGVLKAGVPTSVSVDVALDKLNSSTGPLEAEDLYWNPGSGAASQYKINVDSDKTVTNPGRTLITTKFEANGALPAALIGYTLYNVNNEFRLYSAQATSAGVEGVDYIVLPTIILGQGSLSHANMKNFFNLRFEYDAEYNVDVFFNGHYAGSLPAPANTDVDTCGVKDYKPSEITVMNIANGMVHSKNGVVAQQSAEAVQALKALKSLQRPEMIGSQIKINASNNYSVRFLAEVNREIEYFESIGYDYVMINAEGESSGEQSITLTKVYEAYLADGDPCTAPNGGYVMAFVISDIPLENGERQTFTVTPWIESRVNGVKLTGDSYTVTYINDNGTIRVIKPTDDLMPEMIFGSNPAMSGSSYIVNRNLTLPTKVGVTDTAIRWESSNEAVLETDGTVHRPEGDTPATVTLTAHIGEGSAATQITYSIVVEPVKVLLYDEDVDPYKGRDSAMSATSNVLTVDGTRNSIVGDMGSTERINRATLFSTNTQTRVAQNFVSLYYSNDNVTYTLIPEYTMHITGSEIHFYNFDVEARYLKIHFTYIEDPEAAVALTNTLQKAMHVYYSEDPLLAAQSSFSGKTTVTVTNNTAEAIRNKIVTYTLADLGIAASSMKGDRSDIRFRANGYELPHYYSNGQFYVRVLNIPANSSVEVTVLYGNANAVNVSDGTATLEIEYGTKYSEKRPAAAGVAWRNSVATMPDGSLLRMGGYLKDENSDGDRVDSGERALSWERSTDGGYTWTTTKKIPGTADVITGGGGFIVDYKNNVVFYLAYTDGDSYILKSTNSGYNWTVLGKVALGAITYADGIALSGADGTGSNVDYVFPIVKNSTHGNGLLWADYSSSLYSTDGGATWVLSETSLTFGEYPKDSNPDNAAYWTEHESGVGECTIWEKENGTLIMYSRYQGHLNGTNNVNHFLVSYSYDSGKTWKDTKVSTVRTTETQPVIDKYDDAAMLLWGGNNMLNFRSYARFPLNIAVSADDAETFIGILDITHGTTMASREDHRPTNEANINITNPDIAVATYNGVEFAYIVTDMHFIVLENFRDFLYLTKGAFDSFESGSLKGEGWMAISGTKLHYWNATSSPNAYHPGVVPTIGTTGATEGSYAMQLGSQTEVSRSVPYVTNGEVFFDLYVSSLTGGYTLELQSSYTNNYRGNAAKVSPMRLYIDASGNVCYYNAAGSKVDTGLNVTKNASNTISIRFNAATETATVTVNGTSASIAFNADAGAYVCFVHMRNGASSSVSIDRFGLVDHD